MHSATRENTAILLEINSLKINSLEIIPIEIIPMIVLRERILREEKHGGQSGLESVCRVNIGIRDGI